MKAAETHLQYAQRVGTPRDVPCNIQLGPWRGYIWHCAGHDYGFDANPYQRLLGINTDRCPISRLEEWRAKQWAIAEATTAV
jgi:hypothetical protein